VSGLQCVICAHIFSLDELQYVCPYCGQVGTLDVLINPDVFWKSRGNPNRPRADVWREERFLPFATDMPPPVETIPLAIGNTPYFPAVPEGDRSRFPRPFALKDDGRNPTGSLKDRASAMVVHHALTIGAHVVATASTGNAAAALAGICAAIPSVQAVIFVPASAPPAKIAQLRVYGAHVILVDGPYDVAFDLCWEACQSFGWYNRSTGINPFTSEGKKTATWEIVFGADEMPDVVLVPVGDGSIIGGIHKGFVDLKKLGWVAHIPRLIGVQSTNSAALVNAWKNDLDPREMTPQPANTVADSISASLPRDRAKALRAVRQTDGAFIAVSDDEILAAIPALAQSTGVFTEPGGAAAYAGWRAALKQNIISPDERALVMNTGTGLKDPNAPIQVMREKTLQPIEATLDAVKEAVKEFNLEV
jgi:threonine synthase